MKNILYIITALFISVSALFAQETNPASTAAIVTPPPSTLLDYVYYEGGQRHVGYGDPYLLCEDSSRPVTAKEFCDFLMETQGDPEYSWYYPYYVPYFPLYGVSSTNLTFLNRFIVDADDARMSEESVCILRKSYDSYSYFYSSYAPKAGCENTIIDAVGEYTLQSDFMAWRKNAAARNTDGAPRYPIKLRMIGGLPHVGNGYSIGAIKEKSAPSPISVKEFVAFLNDTVESNRYVWSITFSVSRNGAWKFFDELTENPFMVVEGDDRLSNPEVCIVRSAAAGNYMHYVYEVKSGCDNYLIDAVGYTLLQYDFLTWKLYRDQALHLGKKNRYKIGSTESPVRAYEYSLFLQEKAAPEKYWLYSKYYDSSFMGDWGGLSEEYNVVYGNPCILWSGKSSDNHYFVFPGSEETIIEGVQSAQVKKEFEQWRKEKNDQGIYY